MEFPHLCQARKTEDLARSGGIDCGVGLAEIYVIEGVEDFSAELALDAFADLEAFAGGSVDVEEVRAEEGVSRNVAERAGGGPAPGAARAAVGVQLGDSGCGGQAICAAGSGGRGSVPTGGALV